MNTGNEFPQHSQDIQPQKGCLAFFSTLFSRKTASPRRDSDASDSSSDDDTYIRINEAVDENSTLLPKNRDRWNEIKAASCF